MGLAFGLVLAEPIIERAVLLCPAPKIGPLSFLRIKARGHAYLGLPGMNVDELRQSGVWLEPILELKLSISETEPVFLDDIAVAGDGGFLDLEYSVGTGPVTKLTIQLTKEPFLLAELGP